MTIKEHQQLYEELKSVIYTRGQNTENLSPAQSYFVAAMESAAFGEDLLKLYADLVDNDPDISLRNLHAFIIGAGIGYSGNVSNIELTKKFH